MHKWSPYIKNTILLTEGPYFSFRFEIAQLNLVFIVLMSCEVNKTFFCFCVFCCLLFVTFLPFLCKGCLYKSNICVCISLYCCFSPVWYYCMCFFSRFFKIIYTEKSCKPRNVQNAHHMKLKLSY